MDKSFDFKVKNEDKPFTIAGESFKIKSDVKIISSKWSDDLMTMPLVKAMMNGDTLQLTLESINEAIYSHYTITIIDTKFKISFWFT
ncbi:MAG: hypothetical protein QM734_15140 [Cyclobacteriaceae bacterium]